MSNILKAFTLAETLITVAILGIIGAITINILYNEYKKSVLVAQLKREYSVVSSAVDNALVEYNDEVWDKGYFDKYVAPNLKVKTDCTGKKNCYPVKEYTASRQKTSDENKAYCLCNRNGNFDTNTCFYTKLVLENGALISVTDLGDMEAIISNRNNNTIFIDVNGEKGPNKLNYDLHQFKITKDNGLIPCLSDNTFCPVQTKRVLITNKIDYNY